MTPAARELAPLAAELKGEADRVLVLAAGGAALAARIVEGCFAPAEGFPALSTLDSTEPSAVAAAAAAHDPARTIYVVASRTGTTLETNLLFDFFFDAAARTLGDGAAGRRFLAVTEPGSAVATAAEKRGARKILDADPRTPANFAALSHFGLLPAALVGVDVAELVARAARMAEACRAAGAENPGLLLGAALGAEALEGRDKLTLSTARALDAVGAWIEGLMASATGKDGKGIVPVIGEALGSPEVYGDDRVFVRAELSGQSDDRAGQRLATLVEHGHPLIGFVLQDTLDVGAELFRWQFAAATVGRLLSVNPFPEPDLAGARDRASRILSGAKPEGDAGPDASLPELFASMRPRDYFAIVAFLPERPAVAQALARLRLAVRNGRRVATTLAYGPRAHHVVGQLHAGGADRGVFLALSAESTAALPIPGRPWGFESVFAAQSEAEYEALRERGRRAGRIRFGSDPEASVDELTAAVGRRGAP
jgi:transaldolase / glucose-6-phosphate isomerase